MCLQPHIGIVASAPLVVPLTRNWERNRVRTQWLAHRLGIADVVPGEEIFVAGTLAARVPRLREIQEAAEGTRPSKGSCPNAQNASIPGTDLLGEARGSSAGPGMWKWLQGKESTIPSNSPSAVWHHQPALDRFEADFEKV